jgi:hypothetical protein
MYAFIAESIATIPIMATSVPEREKRRLAAVAMGAGETDNTSVPTLPISAMLRIRYKDTTTAITSMSDFRINAGFLVSSATIALISKPVNGQYTIMTVASKPVAVNGVRGTKLSGLIYGINKREMITRGIIFKCCEEIFGSSRKRDTDDIQPAEGTNDGDLDQKHI